MREPTLSGIVKRRFLHCVNDHREPVAEVVASIGIDLTDLCRLMADQKTAYLPLSVYDRIARWLHMPLANVLALAGARPKLSNLVRLGMEVRGQRPTCAEDQISAAQQAGVSVAVFRRALHGYANFSPSIATCDRLAAWLNWTGLEPDDIVSSAGMLVRYRPDGRRVAVNPALYHNKAYPCACGRAGCMVPAHIPSGPRRIWRSDACRMWSKRQTERETRAALTAPSSFTLPQADPIVRFIRINERPVPARF
jgi:hypothetical protein